MSQTVKGVIARGKGLPVELVDINVPKPGPGEARVRVQACGVCHTDLHYREGGINDDFPFLLGHEAAGIVESIGDNVTNVKPGDFVVLNWRAVCGNCRSCLRGKPQLCFSTFNATQKMTLTDGTPLAAALGRRGFAKAGHTLLRFIPLTFPIRQRALRAVVDVVVSGVFMLFPILLLSAAGFTVLTTEFVIVGLLPSIARDLNVSVSQAGLLVTFMAILELVKESLVELVQNEPFAAIHVRARAE